MLNGTPIKYKTYNEEKEVISKNIKFDKDLAENINKTIAIFNSNEKALKLNNDLLINIAVREYLENTNVPEIKEKILKELWGYLMQLKEFINRMDGVNPELKLFCNENTVYDVVIQEDKIILKFENPLELYYIHKGKMDNL